ncbi:MAG TPA: SRPBCC family protein [Mycobacteriales bacterium]
MRRVHVTQEYAASRQQVFAYLSDHENLGPLLGADITRVREGSDGPNGVGSVRSIKVGPLPPFEETNVEVVPDALIRYRITKGGVLKDHEGVMTFADTPGGGCRFAWTITFDGKVPGVGAAVAAGLTRSISKGLPAVDDLARR